MKDLSGFKITEEAQKFANEIINQKLKKQPLSLDVVKKTRSSAILGTEYGLDVAYSLILGAIMEYHAQLRENLLHQGIDIGEFEEDED